MPSCYECPSFCECNSSPSILNRAITFPTGPRSRKASSGTRDHDVATEIVHGTGQLANAARAKEAALIDLMNARAGRAEADATTPSIPEPEAAPAVPIPDPEPPTPPPEVGNAKAAPAVPIPDPEPLPEGASRYLSKELVRAAGAITGVPSYYCAHVGRGKWQDKSIEELHASLGEGKNRGRLLMSVMSTKKS